MTYDKGMSIHIQFYINYIFCLKPVSLKYIFFNKQQNAALFSVYISLSLPFNHMTNIIHSINNTSAESK